MVMKCQKVKFPETQENEEVYHVNIDDETHPSNEFRHKYTRQNSQTVDPTQISASRVQQRGRGRRESTLQRSSGTSRISIASGSRGSRRKQFFETTLTDTMTGFREFQRQSLRPNPFDQEDFNECDIVKKIFEAMDLPTNTKFYWECIKAFREDEFWRKYFIARTDKPFEDKIQFLQAISEYTRDDERVGKRLNSGHHFGSPSSACFPYSSPISGGFPYGSPYFGGNNSWGQTSGGQWGPCFQQ